MDVKVGYRVRFGEAMRGEQVAHLRQLNGAWRLIGVTTPESSGVAAAAANALKPGSATSLEPHDITALAQTPAGSTPNDDAATTPATNVPGLGPSWTRSWRTEPYGGVRVTASRYDSSAHALAAIRASLVRDGSDYTASFSIPGAQEAVGVRIRAFAYTGIQPADIGPYLDRVAVVHGNLAMVIQWAYAPGAEHRAELRALFAQVDTAVRNHP